MESKRKYFPDMLISCAWLVTAIFFMACQVQAKEDIDIVDRSKAEEVMRGEKDDIPLISDEGEELVDESYEQISEKLISAATWFDSFFSDERYVAEENRTTAKLKLDFGWDKHEDFEFRPRVNWRIHLPGLKNRANLLISARDDEDFDVDRHAGGASQRDDDANLSAGLQYYLKQTKKMNISTTAGVSFNYAYAGLRYRGKYDYGSWQGRLTSRLRYYTDDGWEFKNQYDLERQVSARLLFRTTLDANWYEEEDGIPHSVVLSLFHVFGLDRAILYDVGAYFNTRPDYMMTDTVLRLRYRQRFYRDWLVFELAPQVSFPKEYDREINPGIILRLEAEFGYKSYAKQFNNIFSF